eukprot:g12260.t1
MASEAATASEKRDLAARQIQRALRRREQAKTGRCISVVALSGEVIYEAELREERSSCCRVVVPCRLVVVAPHGKTEPELPQMDAQNYTIIYFGSDESNPSCAYWGIVPNETMMVMNPMMPSSPMVPVPNSMPTWSLPPMMPMGSILPMMPPMIPVDGGVWVPWMPGGAACGGAGFDAMNMLKATCAGGAERCVGEAFLKELRARRGACEPEPEVEGSLTGMTATPPGTRTVDKTEKTSELMKSLAKKLWSDLDGEEAQDRMRAWSETPAEVIDLMLADGAPQAGEDEAPEKVEIQVDRDGHIKGLEILNLLKRGKVAPSETGESLASIESTEICERSTVASTVTSPRNRKRRSPGQRRFCCRRAAK